MFVLITKFQNMETLEISKDVYKPRDKEFGCRALAKMFNVSKSTMSYILTNKTYL